MSSQPLIQLAGAASRAGAETLVDVLDRRANEAPDRLAYAFLDGAGAVTQEWTYAQVRSNAHATARALIARVAPGDRVLLTFNPGLEFIAAYFGCLYAGTVPVPTHMPRARYKDGELRPIAEDSGAKVALANARIVARLHAALEGKTPVLAFEETQRDAGAFEGARLHARDLALLQYTSGSTGRPKGVMVTHANILANSRAIQEAFGNDEAGRGVTWLPAYHDMGLIGGVIQPLFAGFPAWLMSPFDFLQRPARWLRAISRLRATTSGAPNFAYQLCTARVSDEDAAGLDLSSWSVAFNGAEAVRDSALRAFTERFAPHGFRGDAFVPCYGLAESTLMVTSTPRPGGYQVRKLDAEALATNEARPARPGFPQRVLVSCGTPIAGHEVVPVAESGDVCEPGEIGELLVRGPSVALGYWRKPELSEGTFGAVAGVLGGGFLRTGDFGWMQDGHVFVCGRLKDVIVLAGRNYAAEEIESTLAGCHEALHEQATVALGVDDKDVERLMLVQEVANPAARDVHLLERVERAIREAVAGALGLTIHKVVFVLRGAIPRTTSGKVRRAPTKELWERGELLCLRADAPAALVSAAS